MSEAADPFCAALADYLRDELVRDVIFVNDIPYPDRLRGLQDGTLDVGWICGVDYVGRIANSAFQLIAAPIMQGARYQNQPVYFSDVLVRCDSPYQTFDDLRGARWVYNEPGSFSGAVVMRHHLRQFGAGDDFFGEAFASGAHSVSLKMVLDGQADVTAIDSMVLDQVLRREPEIQDQVRVVARLGPNPIPPWVGARSLTDGERDALRAAFLGMSGHPRGREILAQGLFAQFTSIKDSDYDPIRQIMAFFDIYICTQKAQKNTEGYRK